MDFNNFILIENGEATISPELQEIFPEITVTIVDNVVTIGNVWREDLISVLGDNVFWAEKQPFSSYSIIFSDNETSVDALNPLLVRYVNFHDEDYTINIPKYISEITKIRDPLQFGIRPNYYNALATYAEGGMTSEELSDIIRQAYSAVLQTDDTTTSSIKAVIDTIAIVDIEKFLASALLAVPVYDIVKNNSEKGISGSKDYNLDTSTKELGFTEDNGSFNIHRLCVQDEDITELKQYILANNTVISQCMLKHLTYNELKNSNIVKITTDFGTTVDFTTDFGVTYAKFNLKANNGDTTLLASLIADVFLRTDRLGRSIMQFSVNGEFTGDTFWRASNNLRMLGDINHEYLMGAMATAKDIVLDNSDNQSYSNEPVEIKRLDISDDTLVPISIIKELEEAYPWVFSEQYCQYTNLDILKIGFLVNYTSGVLLAERIDGFSCTGTSLGGSVIEVTVYTEELFIVAVRLGFSTVTLLNTDIKLVNNELFGNINSVPFALGLTRVGVSHFKTTSLEVARELSLHGINVDIDLHDISAEGSLLLIPYFPVNKNTGLLVSDIVPTDDTIPTGVLSEIFVNGVRLTDKQNILNTLMRKPEVTIFSRYSIHSSDLATITNILRAIQDGYAHSFRNKEGGRIEDESNQVSYTILSLAYDAIFQNTSSLFELARGGEVVIQTPATTANIAGLSNQHKLGISLRETGCTIVYENDITNPNTYIEQGGVSIGADGLIVSSGSISGLESLFGWGSIGSRPCVIKTEEDGDVLTVYCATQYYYGTDGTSKRVMITPYIINQKHMVFRTNNSFAVPYAGSTPAFSHTPQVLVSAQSHEIVSGNYVKYTFTENADGSITVNYTAFDKDDNDITDQFNTLSIGDYFLHKEVD